MPNPYPVSGQPQRDPLEVGKNAPTPEKFKKVMGVDDSDASQQQNKRNPTRQTDEEEGEEDKQIEAKPDLFSELMSKKQSTKISLGATRQTTQEVSNNGGDNENLFKNISEPSTSTDQDSINLKNKDADQNQNGPSYTSPPTQSTPPSIASTPTDISEEGEVPLANKKSHDHFKELDAIEQKLKKLHPSHPKVPTESTHMSTPPQSYGTPLKQPHEGHPPLVSIHHEKVPNHVSKNEKKEKEKPAPPQSYGTPLKQPHEGHPPLVSIHHEKVPNHVSKNEKKEKEKPAPPQSDGTPLIQPHEGDPPLVSIHHKKVPNHVSKKEKKEKEVPVLPSPSLIPSKQPQEDPQPLQVPAAIATSSNSPLATTPPYAQFPPQVFELFQKLVGMMTVMQFQGKTTTSIVLHVPNSGLDGAHIDIEHYDTAPHAFNISFFSSPEGQKILDANIATLEQQLRSNLPQFEISVKKPLLLSETREERRRRETQVKRSKG